MVQKSGSPPGSLFLKPYVNKKVDGQLPTSRGAAFLRPFFFDAFFFQSVEATLLYSKWFWSDFFWGALETEP